MFTRKRIAVALGTLLLAVLGAAGTVGYLAFLRSPAHAAADVCAGGRPQTGGPVVVAAGASMTQGSLGRDWVGDLRAMPEFRGYAFVNAGDNGNTSADLLGRVDRDIVACAPDRVTVLIGANDLRNGVPLEEFRANLGAIIDRVKDKTSARIALLSLPPAGEDLGSGINRELRGYNAVIEETAARAEVDYVPVNEKFTDHLRGRGSRPAYDFGFTTAYLAATKHYLLGHSWDEVARENGLELYVDHLHLSDRGGAMLTHVVAQWLSSPEGAARNQR
ncbi:SGNH/GDSL hydrolase family protein [Streptomyces filamentosus]